MTGAVEWPMLIAIAGAVTFFCGILLQIFRWVYADSNNTRAEIAKVSRELNESMARVREEIARQYVSLEMHSKTTATVDRAIQELKQENRRAIESLGERIDGALLKLSGAFEHHK